MPMRKPLDVISITDSSFEDHFPGNTTFDGLLMSREAQLKSRKLGQVIRVYFGAVWLHSRYQDRGKGCCSTTHSIPK